MKRTLLLICIALTINAASFGQTTSALRIDGVMLKNGEQFFPVGYYAEGFHTLTENNYAANTLSAAGFNMMFTEHDIQITSAEFSSFLDNCASKGIYNMLSFWDPSTAIDDRMRSFIPTYKNKPSVLVWCIGDDASTLGSIDDVIRKDDLAKSLDANHLTYESFNGAIRSSITQVGQSAIQAYPHFFTGDLMDGYGSWSSFVDIVNQCATNGKTPLANPQSYRWQTGAGFLYPTAAELDVQSYMAIVAGMKGLFFYTFKDDGNSTINLTQTALWDASVQACTEIQTSLKDILLNGDRTTVANVNNDVYYAKWSCNQEEYVIAVNVDKVAHSVSIPVLGTTKNSLFAYRNNTLAINGSNLTGTLGKLDVQIYKITDVPADIEASGIPTGLSTSAVTTSSFKLSWTASTDNVKTVGYEVFKDSISIGNTKTNSINITGLVCGTAGTYTVKAFDFDNNTSAASSVLEVTNILTILKRQRKLWG